MPTGKVSASTSSLAREHAQQPVGAWALGAALTGVELHHRLGAAALGLGKRRRCERRHGDNSQGDEEPDDHAHDHAGPAAQVRIKPS